MVDAEKILAEIRRLKTELQGYSAREALDYIESYINLISREPLLPNDIDEAADNFVWEVMENDEKGISDLCQKLRPSSKISDFYDALGEFFKAGVEWMAGQGVTLKVTDDTTWGEVNDFIHRNCDSVKEIQIRKK